MSKTKVVIVGGVAGGASTAARLRRMDENIDILLVEKGEHISFANCGLPYYIGGVITNKDRLLVQTPEAMMARFRIDIRVNTEAISINREEKKISMKNHDSGETYDVDYDFLVLSPGAAPLRPPIPGIDADNIFTLRNIPDTFAIKEYSDRSDVKNAVVVGGGFIGLEMAENLHHKGMTVSVVEMADQVMPPFDFDMAAHIHQHLKQKDVGLYLNNGVKSFLTENGQCRGVVLSDGSELSADIVVLSIGVRPENTLAKEAGLAIGPRGGIVVNKELKTEDPSIFAIGDVIEVQDFMDGSNTFIPLAGPANRQGRIVANLITGNEDFYDGSLGSSVAKVFDLTVASTGQSEKLLKKKGIPYEKSFTHSASHAGYYPGSSAMAVKLLFGKEDGKVLGVQIVGYDGVEKRVDVVATAIYAGLTVFDLNKLQLTYAPPFSSAKDPINMAGYVAENILKGKVKVIHWHDIADQDPKKVQLVDVSSKMEFDMLTVPGAVNIPVNDLRERLKELDPKKKTIVFCRVGLRGYIASRILMQNGFSDVYNLSGAMKTWGPVTAEQQNTIQPKPRDKSSSGQEEEVPAQQIDACGLQCPGPIMKTHQALEKAAIGDLVVLKASDPGFYSDIKVWCEKTGNTLLELNQDGAVITAKIRKGSGIKESPEGGLMGQNKTMVVFSGDLDKAIASFIIANGAAAMGRRVTMFFTFWGLNILRKPKKVRVKAKKSGVEKMFAGMMPRGSKKLKLSQMSMGGMGGKMIRNLMIKKNVGTLEEMMKNAKELGVEMIACNMSMELMGIRREELIDGVVTGGVATFLGSTDESNMSLFI